MLALTPSERRGATVVVLLLAIGAGHDLWRARHPRLAPVPVPWTEASATGSAVSAPAAPGGRPSETPGGPPISAGADRAGDRARVVDLNRASVSDLDALPGIGPVLAKRIVEHRAAHGPFRSLDELLAVRGIGPRLLERLSPHVRAGPGAPSPTAR